jgi:hypothetical protein
MPMPIASMHEYGQMPARKHEVGLTRQIGSVKSESKPQTMSDFSNAKFGGRILPSDS